jgi:hypothetical protein
MILVDSENATDADPCAELTSILIPDTEAIEPLNSSSPLIFTGASDAGAAAADVLADVAEAVGDSVGELLVGDPQAAADKTVIPATARAEKVNDDVRMVAPDQCW